ncbi:MAG: hypothetical protein CM15mP83_3220 [Flavobacteriaceae bacterium]|nr:MAG: hypothetical protein CM15mP83_3220 [Flavobacteriaceae bacterium]
MKLLEPKLLKLQLRKLLEKKLQKTENLNSKYSINSCVKKTASFRNSCRQIQFYGRSVDQTRQMNLKNIYH